MAAPAWRLPPCEARADDLGLTPEQRRDVIRALAEGGTEALEAWLKKEERKDPRIRARVEAARERIQRQVRADRRRAEAEADAAAAEHASSWERRMGEMARREAALRDRLGVVQQRHEWTLDELGGDSALLQVAKGEGTRPGVFARLRDALVWAWVWLVSWWVRLVRLLTGRRDERRIQHVITLPDGTPVSLAGVPLTDARVLAEVRRRMRAGRSVRDRLRDWWNRMTGREDYAETAARMMAEELAQAADRRTAEKETTKAELEHELERLDEEARRRAAERDAQAEALDERRRAEMERLAEMEAQGAFGEVAEGILDELRDVGLVDEAGAATAALLDRFSTLLYEDVRRTLPGGGVSTPGSYQGGDGEYDRGPLMSRNELGAMELVDTMVRARTSHPRVRHIFDDDVLVHREVRVSTTHVVLVFDTSGSMEEKGRLDAAKRVGLVMHRAVRQQSPDDRIDILAMSTGVERVDLAGLWDAEPKGFTNHGAALRDAADLLDRVGADRRVVYVITDGLPEARTTPEGHDLADAPEPCMAYARQEASRLAQMPGTRVHIIQLETADAMFMEAAQALADAANGTVEGMDPADVAAHLLVDFEAQSA